MNFKEFRLLSEAKKDLYAEIGKAPTDALLKTKVAPEIRKMHDHVFGDGNHHIEMPIENDVPEKVKSHIASKGDELDGDNVKLKTGRIAPISKYLAKSNAPKDVQDEHQNWAKNKVGNSKLVITRHPAEVASASTGTHWSSCAQATKKGSKEMRPAWDAMPREIAHGTLMAMHVHKDAKPDKDGQYASKDVLGRTLIKRHNADPFDQHNPDEVSFHREDKKYGAFPEAANKAVDAFTAKHYPQKNLTAHKESGLYNDDNSFVKVNVHHPDIQHAFTKGHEQEQSTNTQKAIVGTKGVPEHVLAHAATADHSDVRFTVGEKSTNPDTIRKVFHNKADRSIHDSYAVAAAAKNPHAPKDVMDAALKHPEHVVREKSVENPNASADHIMHGLKDKNSWVQLAASHHPNLNKDHVNYIMSQNGKKNDYGDDTINGVAIRNAAKSKHATDDHIKTALHHESYRVAASAMENPKINKHHLLHALDSQHSEIRVAAATHDAADTDVVKKALTHEKATVREAALSSSKMTPELFKHAKDSAGSDEKEQHFIKSHEDMYNDIKERQARKSIK